MANEARREPLGIAAVVECVFLFGCWSALYLYPRLIWTNVDN